MGDEDSYVKYACKRCRTVLFDERNVEPHAAPSSHACNFKFRRSFGVTTESSESCTSLFLEPCQDWMGDTTAQDGRLVCPKCQAVVGRWKWGGLQCSCGVWHTPGFQIPLSRVDRILPRPSSSQTVTPVQESTESKQDAEVNPQEQQNNP